MNAQDNGQIRKSGETTENGDTNDIAKLVVHSHFSDTFYYYSAIFCMFYLKNTKKYLLQNKSSKNDEKYERLEYIFKLNV